MSHKASSAMATTVEQIESYFSSLEEFLSSSLAPDFPQLHEIANRIWADITRFGPPSLPIPGLGAFKIPPSPPLPPPPPLAWSERLTQWTSEHKWAAAGAGVGVVGAGLFAGYGLVKYKRDLAAYMKKDSGNERREVVVVLGADHPVGSHLVVGLEAQGYIVIASVSTADATETLESKSKGYIRVLVLDPREPQTVTHFLRSLQSCLSLRFPTNTAGDPYLASSASPFTRPYIHSLISLLTLFPVPSPTPLESVFLTDSYLPYLIRTHITPLRVIQSLLPLLRRGSCFPGEGTTRKNIVVCVPAMGARVGVTFSGEEAMSAAATVKAMEVLRRELNVAASRNPNDGSRPPKVVLVDVGAISLSRHRPTPPPMYDPPSLMQAWSASEKAAYGAALEGALEQARAAPRSPVHANVFVDALLGVISSGARGRGYGYGFKHLWGWGIFRRWALGGWGRVVTWIRGDRFSVGAGAMTYSLASYLPPAILDRLLYIPHAIISIRNALLLPEHPHVLPVKPAEPNPRQQRLIENANLFATLSTKEKGPEGECSDAASEVDSASMSGASESGVIGGSWVSLKDGLGSGFESGQESAL